MQLVDAVSAQRGVVLRNRVDHEWGSEARVEGGGARTKTCEDTGKRDDPREAREELGRARQGRAEKKSGMRTAAQIKLS